MTEVWLPIANHTDYQVSNLGQVRSNKYGVWRLLTPRRKRRGYLNVALCKKGHASNHDIHTLVLTTFVGPRPEGLVCCHLDSDPSNNCVTNLEWNTQSENNRQCSQAGRYVGSRKLTEGEVRTIRNSGLTNRQLATQFGLHIETIRKARVGITYKNVVA